MPILRQDVYTDTSPVHMLLALMPIVRAHPGNDTLEMIVHTPEGLQVFESARKVDAWDPNLRAKLKEAVKAL